MHLCEGVKRMNFEFITSKDNRLIKDVRKLISSSKERREQSRFILEGLRLCADAAFNNYGIETAIVSENVEESDRLQTVLNKAQRVVQVSDSLFQHISDTVSPQGVLCVVKMPQTVSSFSELENGKFIVLENTSDPSNLGAIARTAEALGIDGLIVSANGCDVFSPKSQRAAMGALLRLPVFVSKDILSDINTLKSNGFTVYASVVSDADCDVTEVQFKNKIVVLIGNEANGLTQEAINAASKKITITMKGKAESLNAAAAAAIFMWEMSK